MKPQKIPPQFKARVFFSVPGNVDLERNYCKFTDLMEHPILQWVKKITARPHSVVTDLSGWPHKSQPWLRIDANMRQHRESYNIDDWNERENEILDYLINRGEILMQVYVEDGNLWRPHK